MLLLTFSFACASPCRGTALRPVTRGEALCIARSAGVPASSMHARRQERWPWHWEVAGVEALTLCADGQQAGSRQRGVIVHRWTGETVSGFVEHLDGICPGP